VVRPDGNHPAGRQLRIDFKQTPNMAGNLEHWQYDTYIARWDDRGIEPAYVSFALVADGGVKQITMKRCVAARRFQLGLPGPAVHADARGLGAQAHPQGVAQLEGGHGGHEQGRTQQPPAREGTVRDLREGIESPGLAADRFGDDAAGQSGGGDAVSGKALREIHIAAQAAPVRRAVAD
jgi:hypothetical protein